MQDKLEAAAAATSNARLEKERVERSLAESERRSLEQEGKIASLTAYAKERKEEAKMPRQSRHVPETL